jgi:hypothetical protein
MAAEALFVPCPKAVTAEMSTADTKKIRTRFIRVTLLNLLEPKKL